FFFYNKDRTKIWLSSNLCSHIFMPIVRKILIYGGIVMPKVLIEGVYMDAGIVTNEYNGEKKSKLVVDLYQKNERGNETVKVTSQDVSLYQQLADNYKMGVPFKCYVTVNAYKNNAYYSLDQIVK
uniref:hypothetical protein n=2 Tax=Bacillus TaxID=1386 RepID=UPI0021B60FEF